jgi:RNA polymerase sigma-70 factor, ECF subfamily
MLRITATNESERTLRVRIEGDLTRQSIDQLRDLRPLSSHPPLPVELDLSRLRFADASGAAQLRELAAKGAVLAGASPYVAELLHGGRAPDGSSLLRPPSTSEPVEAASAPRSIDSEADLLARLRAGDPDAFAEVVRTLGGRLLATARRMLRDEEDARDVVQETFLAAFKSIDSFSGGSKLSTWLHSIATNAALMRMRSRRRRPEARIDDLLPRFDETGHWADEPASWDPPADALETRRLRMAVRRCIDRLPETQRTILLLRDVEDLSTAEAADQLGITATAVKLRLHRARIALRTLLERELEEPR